MNQNLYQILNQSQNNLLIHSIIKKIYVPNQAAEAGPGSPPAKKSGGRPRKNLTPPGSVITVTPAAGEL
jgi:hypothetical protein